MQETLNRLARHADNQQSNILVMMDQVNEKARRDRLASMYAHILGRAEDHKEMRRIIEPPMHIDSQLSSNIQFADWICALVKRAIEYQLVNDSRYSWLPRCTYFESVKGKFTYESKLHLFQRDVRDIYHSYILNEDRIITHLGSPGLDPANKARLEKVRKATIRGL